ncbi:hypothetical protein NL529_28360, partial [Klebsiella pneumoniae]|nr:hypothetical protein [Klebsiella pneumoniae]
ADILKNDTENYHDQKNSDALRDKFTILNLRVPAAQIDCFADKITENDTYDHNNERNDNNGKRCRNARSILRKLRDTGHIQGNGQKENDEYP